VRQASVSYLASFLARANYLEKELIAQQLKLMSEWLHRYMKHLDGRNIQQDYRKHASFYSCCQAMLYVFVYHYQSYVDTSTSKGTAFIKSLDFSRIVLSKLNPLRFCLSTVVSVFARITRMYEIVFCYSTIEKNNRRTLTMNKGRDESVIQSHLEEFFPFDPYMLPKSGTFIKALYSKWSGAHIEDDVEEEEGDDDDENSASVNDDVDIMEDGMEEIDELFESMGQQLSLKKYSSSRKSAHSFDMMCVSPGFSLHNT